MIIDIQSLVPFQTKTDRISNIIRMIFEEILCHHLRCVSVANFEQFVTTKVCVCLLSPRAAQTIQKGSFLFLAVLLPPFSVCWIFLEIAFLLGKERHEEDDAEYNALAV